ncbi:hypothetical protein V8F20_006115 [Naviculisporaceae sp. PSN 640]
MEALTNLVNNIPDWQQKLDELNGKIAQRQIELARLTENQSSTSPGGIGSTPSIAKSVRNKGSTESLKPPGEPAAHPREITPQPESAPQPPALNTNAGQEKKSAQNGSPPSPAESQSPSAIQRQTDQMKAAGQARARATLRKRQRTDSVVSAENQAPKYRTRSMIIVYYDSYVQSFFEELVKFVSASRNMMRKAKMAAKVAQIRRLAEMEMPESDEEEDNAGKPAIPGAAAATTATLAANFKSGGAPSGPIAVDTNAIEVGNGTDGEEEISAIRFTSTRRMPASMTRTQNLLLTHTSAGRGIYSRAGGPRSYGRPGGAPGASDPPDIYDELDKGLEYVQSMCEHAAHQFLRDGDCAEEVANIQRRMGETKDIADKEMARVRKEEPEALKAAEEAFKGRSYRPQSMRKAGAGNPGFMAAQIAAKDSNVLEVDEGVEDMEYDDEIPKLVYKSTRRMMG